MNAPTASRLIRNLIGVFFTPQTLAVSSACGNRVNPRLDQDIVETCICKLIIYIYLIQNSQAVKKECGPEKGYGEKRCEIQGGGQEMAVMVG